MPAGINHSGSRGGNASVMVVAESFEGVSALVRASLGRAGIDNELAGDVIERAEHGNPSWPVPGSGPLSLPRWSKGRERLSQRKSPRR
jgi:hypothetical protein